MDIKTEFSCGDLVWCIVNARSVEQLTVGRVSAIVTDSPGCDSEFDNYKKQKNYSEEYMCIETGIGTGSVFTAGKNIFSNKISAETALEANKE